MTDATPTRRTADSSVPIHELLDERWSPRSYDESARIDDATLASLLEAARWAPSASNTQPRRFIVGRRGTATFDGIVENLMSFNAVWAPRAAALVVALAEPVAEDGREQRWAEYDLGQSLAHLTVQAHAHGLHVHQMGGIDLDGLRRRFAVPERLVPVTVTAIGVVADASRLDEKLAAREVQPRERRPLDELVLVAE
jgi:nitroreductase